MADHNIVGKKGEQIAANYLLDKGYEILAMNWRWNKAELDIVAKDGNWLVFAEVKTRQANSLDKPEDAVTPKKQKMLIKAANAYIEASGTELECRFDVLAVYLDKAKHTIKQYEQAFYPFP